MSRRDRRAERVRPRSRRPRTLTVVAAGLLLWSLTTLVSWPSSTTATLAVTSPAIALPALAVVAASLPRRRWTAAVLATLAGLLPWVLVVGYASPGDSPSRGEVPLRVMSFNAHLGRADAEAVVEAVRTEDVDVLVLVEARGTLTNRLTRAGIGRLLTPVSVSSTPTEPNSLVVYSRLPAGDFRDVGSPSGPITVGTVQTAAGPVRLIAAHVTSPVRDARPPFVTDAQDWTADLRRLADVTREAAQDGDPVVVLGDLNATPWHAPFRALERDGGVEDVADLLGRGLRPTWPTLYDTGGVVPLDHVLVTPGVGVRDLGTVVVPSSDHAAIVAGLRLARRP